MVLFAHGALLMILALLLAACQVTQVSPTANAALVSPSPEITSEPTPAEWIEQEVNGVLLGVEKPSGWQAQKTDDGILLAEHSGSMATGGEPPRGVQIHIFVHSLAGFQLNDVSNVAWSVLKQIIQKHEYIGSAQANEPYGFEWSRHDAAFYLSNNGDGNMTMLIGVAMPNAEQMVVCNVTSPASESARIRDILPNVLRTLSVNGVQMDVTALAKLPDPLEFPPYTARPKP